MTRVGVLALQGAFARHAEVLDSLSVAAVEVRTADELAAVDALIIPGGESTTMTMLIDRLGLREPLAHRLAADLPVLGTCAGMILLAAEVIDGRADQTPLGAIDLTVRRNAFGRQVDSFETELDIDGMAEPFPAVFIRAPWIERAGPQVEVLAWVDEHPVLCREGSVLVAAFHPELTDDRRVHELFLSEVVRHMAR